MFCASPASRIRNPHIAPIRPDQIARDLEILQRSVTITGYGQRAISAVRRGRRVEFKEIGDSTDQIDLCAAAPVVGTG
jgi:hypothetical protein